MSKSSLNNISNISKEQLEEISIEISSIADASSELIYVYSFPFVPRDSGVTLLETGSRNNVVSEKKALFGNAHGRVRRSRKWAVRVEGNSVPEAINFSSQKTAAQHANRLLAKGLGKKVVIVA